MRVESLDHFVVTVRDLDATVRFDERVLGMRQETLYRSESDYVFDSGKFRRAFGVAATSYAEGIRLLTASAYL